MNRNVWIGAGVGAVAGLLAWFVFEQSYESLYDVSESVGDLATGIWVMSSARGRIDWLGYVVFGVVGALAMFLIMFGYTSSQRTKAEYVAKIAQRPHPMD